MGAIDDLVQGFNCHRNEYENIETELGHRMKALCNDYLQGNGYSWHSRVKKADSLAEKLRGRAKKYANERENVKVIKDLIGGRIVLINQSDFNNVDKMIREKFDLIEETQHPKESLEKHQRFRGYDGLHYHVTREEPLSDQYRDLIIEIQVMSPLMWLFSALVHDIEYKEKHGEPTKEVKRSLELLKGVINLGEVIVQQFEACCYPEVQELHSKRHEADFDVQAAIRNLVHGAAKKVDKFDKKDWQCLRELRLNDPRQEKIRIESSKDSVLESSCTWFFDKETFANWWDGDDSRLLWIHGGPGKGKTMLTMAIISEVSSRLRNLPGSNVLTYFFCQNTFKDLNSTVSLLRGLIN